MAVHFNRHHQSDAADFAEQPSVGTPPPARPDAPALNAENIPQELLAAPRWVVWRYAERGGKPTKVPYNARTGEKAASDDPRTWTTFDGALTAFGREGFDGVGFMLGDGWTGIDLDKCFDPETGEIQPDAAQIIAGISSYTEVSPSGCGIHIIIKGHLPSGRRRTGNIEMYDSGRYFTITGNVYGDHREVAERQAEVEVLHARIFAADARPAATTVPSDKQKVEDTASVERGMTEPLILDPDADPPFEKFDMLCDIEHKFKLSWNHQRPDLDDQSQSAYDQSLANFAALVSWSDQEIADLIIANRRKHRVDLKLRKDYYRRTIARAREFAEPVILDQKLAELVGMDAGDPASGPSDNASGIAAEGNGDGNYTAPAGEPGTAETVGAAKNESGQVDADAGTADSHVAGDPKKRDLLKILSARFKVPITRIVKYTGEPTLYRLETGLGNVQLGGVAGLINQSKLRISIADATGRFLPYIDPDKWPPVAQALLDVCELVDRGEDATLHGTMGEWLRAYLAEKSIHPTLAEADEGREPFRDGGAVAIFLSDLKRWLQTRQNERVAQGRLTADLRAFGAEPEVFRAVLEGRPTSRSAWRLPDGSWIPANQAPERG